MLMRTRENFAVAMTALMILTTTPSARAQEQVETSPAAGFFGYSGGMAKAKRARTQTALSNFPVGGAWQNLPGATLGFVVPANTTDLFNVAFSAECAKLGGGPLYIRIFHTINGVVQPPVEPYDGFQNFCSLPNPATNSGLWVRRVGAGNHILQVQFLNPGPMGSLGQIDDWTFELVVYE